MPHDDSEAHVLELPVLAVRDSVVFPGIVMPVLVGRPRSRAAVEAVMSGDADEKRLVVVAMPDPTVEEAGASDLHTVGTLVRVIQLLKLPDNSIRVVIEGIERVAVEGIEAEEPFLLGRVRPLRVENAATPEAQATLRSLLARFKRMAELAPYLPEQLVTAAMNVSDPEAFAEFLAANVNVDLDVRQDLLETLDVPERLGKLLRILNEEVELLELGSKISEQVQGEIDEQQREFVLRRQLDAIRRELGEDDESAEYADLAEQIKAKPLPEEARDEALRELRRLEKIPSASPEHSVIRTYLDWMLELPWGVRTEDRVDVAVAHRMLDEDHLGLEKPKDRILEYLAVRHLKDDMRGPILCFVGPPGVGKTSLGQSIARALGRRFVRMSLGGVRDEAELRGHRRTYIGAMPGRVVSALRRAGSMNPVIMLDEVDKLGADYRGDPAAALLEVLDPAQNDTFRDHYLDVPLDLSGVLFIATANVEDTIPGPLLDRLETIRLPGYTEPEKHEIARDHLIPKQLDAHGVAGTAGGGGAGVAAQVEITDDALGELITGYTREAGVRGLDRQIASLVRKAAREMVEGAVAPVRVDVAEVRAWLGPERFEPDVAGEQDEIGIATGLAWTAAGGDVLFVEVAVVPGSGKLTLTGQLGDVMQESARAAITWARRHAPDLGLDPTWADAHDVHIHVPAGAIPKDGPSAGITMTTSLVSALTERPVQRTVGMTGEITLRGKVLPIGGVKEKLLAAHRAGLTKVLIPSRNRKDLADVPAFVLDALDVVAVADMDEVLGHALGERIPSSGLGRETRHLSA
ncbi:MAG: endopeptidase La [Acidimicrobiia bacterium]|nr:endopeptidase La [Acidimicrobiia bacterium]